MRVWRLWEQLDEDGQVDFKGKAKAFTRTYGFLSSVLPYTNAEWEKLSIFLNFLVPKLPAPVEEDLSKGILEAIDMDSYRVEKQAAVKIQLPDADAEIEPVPAIGGGRKPDPSSTGCRTSSRASTSSSATSLGPTPTACTS
jgi:type I restriction enzyme R subunit